MMSQLLVSMLRLYYDVVVGVVTLEICYSCLLAVATDVMS